MMTRIRHVLIRCPRSLALCLVALLLIYVPEVWATAAWWFGREQNAHGMFVFPIAIWLLWMQREQILQAVPRPTAWGLLPLALGLLMQIAGHLLDFKFLGMVSLIPVIAGCVLFWHGPNLWRVVQFPVCFLFFAAKIPVAWLNAPAAWVQHCSVVGAATIMKTLGYPLFRSGNIIELPGVALEVVEACSGFRKLTALILFATLYGYLYPISLRKRVFLILMVAPIAVLANIVRVCGLIAAAWAGGPRALTIAHDWAELAVLVLAFAFTVLLGKHIGCAVPKFFLPAPSPAASAR